MFLLLVTVLLSSLYIYYRSKFSYWSKRNIKHDTPIPLFGNHFRNSCSMISLTQLSSELYKKYPNEKVIGYYRWSTPSLFIKDLDIARRILSMDFGYFYRRGLGRDPSVEPLLLNLFSVDGDRWKLLRQRLTPAFTTAKLKKMFPLVVECAEKLQTAGEQIVAQGGEYDVRELMARFTTEFIGACGFGISMDTISNERSLFRDLGKMMFSRSLGEIIRFSLWEAFPSLRKKVRVSGHEVEDTIKGIVKSICEQRNHKPSGRNDFIDLLLDLETKGKIVGESIERSNDDGTPVPVEMEMDLPCMAAQVFVFFAAGFETSSSATSFTLHKLAYNPDVQRKVHADIDKVMLKYNNKLCYDAVSEMAYLDMAFKEAMRMFPSLGVLNRVCAKTYEIPDLNIKIDPGVNIVIPIEAIQNDEKYFDSPEQFRPERFRPEATHERHRYSYLPFGEGPRACIGARLGQMQSLAGLAALLHRFRVEPASTSRPELEINPRSNVVQAVRSGARLGQMQSLAGLAALLHRFRVEPASTSLARAGDQPALQLGSRRARGNTIEVDPAQR
ncbi:hypothetical protein ACJJTC_004172 [Scirpophaga incertulas]